MVPDPVIQHLMVVAIQSTIPSLEVCGGGGIMASWLMCTYKLCVTPVSSIALFSQ